MLAIDPLHFVGGLVPQIEDSAFRKRKRREWLSELELEGTDSLAVGDQSVTRNDILEIFDMLDSADVRDYLRVLHGNPVLSRLFNAGEVPGSLEDLWKSQSTYAKLQRHACHSRFEVVWTHSLCSAVVGLADRRSASAATISKFIRTFDDPASSSPFYRRWVTQASELEQSARSFAEVISSTCMVDLTKLDRRQAYRITAQLPPRFVPQRVALAGALRGLSVDLWNKRHDSRAALEVLDHALIVADGLGLADQLRVDQRDVQQAALDHQKFARVKPFLDRVFGAAKEADAGRVSGGELNWIVTNGAAAAVDLNALGNDEESRKTRSGVALTLRGLAVDAWNGKLHKDYTLRILAIASTLNVEPKVRALLDADKAQLTVAPKAAGGENTGCVLGIAALVIFIIIAAMSKH